MAKKKNIKLHIKKGDTVEIIAGDYKGEKGTVIEVFPDANRAIVEGMNIVKRHVRPTAETPGGVFEKEAPIHISNLMLVDSNGEAHRIGREKRDGKTVRVFKNDNKEVLD